MVKFIERDRSRFLVDNIPINIGDLVNLGSELVQVRRHDTMIKEEALRQLQARESAKPSAQNMAEIYGADLVMVSDFPAEVSTSLAPIDGNGYLFIATFYKVK